MDITAVSLKFQFFPAKFRPVGVPPQQLERLWLPSRAMGCGKIMGELMNYSGIHIYIYNSIYIYMYIYKYISILTLSYTIAYSIMGCTIYQLHDLVRYRYKIPLYNGELTNAPTAIMIMGK